MNGKAEQLYRPNLTDSDFSCSLEITFPIQVMQESFFSETDIAS
jgi:hypothetical protein